MRAGLLLAAVALAGCSSQPHYVDLPSNHGRSLDDALRRLHAVGLRVSFPAARTSCGNGLPGVQSQSPRAPARVERGSVVTLHFGVSLHPSPGVPIHHERWTYVPPLDGEEFAKGAQKLHAIWPCVHVQPATATSDSRVVVVAQNPRAGTRLPAYGVLSGRGFRPTTVTVTVAAQP